MILTAAILEALLCLEIKFIEELELAGRFGEVYLEYKKETPFVFPGLRRFYKNNSDPITKG